MIDKFAYSYLNRIYGYDDYTQQEINGKLIQKMDEVIENCNSAFEFVEWLKTQGVPEEVQTIINMMLEDGTIENLIEIGKIGELRLELKNDINQLSDELNEKINELRELINQNNSELN